MSAAEADRLADVLLGVVVDTDAMLTFREKVDLNNAAALLRTQAAALAEREWIAVSERLPEHLTLVLTFGPSGPVVGAWQKRDDFPNGRLWALADRRYSPGRQELFAPTHWMPLPALPLAAAPSPNKEQTK